MNWVLSGSEKDRHLCVFSEMSQTEKKLSGILAYVGIAFVLLMAR